MSTTTIATPDEPNEPEGRKPRRGRSRKRSNGEGTIYQRKDGRYEGAAYVPTTAGTFKRVRLYGRSHDEVRRKMTKLLEQADKGIPVAAESWTVERYLTYWLDHVVRVERRPKTYQGYEGVVRRYLIPELGKKRLGKAYGSGRPAVHHPRPRGVPVLPPRLGRLPRDPALLRQARPGVLRLAPVGPHGPVHPRRPPQRPGGSGRRRASARSGSTTSGTIALRSCSTSVSRRTSSATSSAIATSKSP